MVCTSHLAFPRAMQAWAGVLHGVDCPGSTGKPDSSVFATTELMSAADSGLSIDEVWDQKYGGFFKASAPPPPNRFEPCVCCTRE
jgi:hypothetical protein